MSYTNGLDKPSDYFNTILYTGTGSSLANTGVGFQPDWVWIKGRSGATEHVLTDSVRGVTKELSSNDTGAEETVAQGLTAFGSDGFTVGTDGSYNTSSATYVSWNWLANGAGVSNSDGSITSTVSANTTSGFSIGTYTGNGTSGANIGHSLGSTPSMIIVKSRTESRNWSVFHQSNGATKNLSLDTDDAVEVNAGRWNDTEPTSSVFTIGNSTPVNNSGQDYVFYCFAEKKGFSKFGSYTGNGSATDGTFVYIGFKPAFVMYKNTSQADDWFISDSKRLGYNPDNHYLRPSLSAAEGDPPDRINFFSNGFKLTTSDKGANASGDVYIYMAFAENPFVTSGGVPACAR